MARDNDAHGTAAGQTPRLVVTRLNESGRWAEAVHRADQLLDGTTDFVEVVGVLMAKLEALLGIGDSTECAAVLDTLWGHLQELPRQPGPMARFYALAAQVALAQGSLQRCIGYLIAGERMLSMVGEDDDAMRSLLSMADTYSMIGLHEQAMVALLHAQRVSVHGSDSDRRLTADLEIGVRRAAYLDQQGQTQAAFAILGAMLERTEPEAVLPVQCLYLGYAAVRFATLGGRYSADTFALMGQALDPRPEAVEIIRLGRAALALTEDRCEQALALLESAATEHCRLGPAEVQRLRVLAYERAGDHRAALRTQCEITALFAQSANQLHKLIVEGMAARLDYQALRSRMRHFADEAHTDALTGLPNRRHLQRRLAELGPSSGGSLAVGDVDRFKRVNTVHGHLAGDMVLAQIAAILARTMRDSDFLARYGGDEFVVVLPNTNLAEARKVVGRLTAAVADHDWDALVPGTSVSLTMAVAHFDEYTDLSRAFEAADFSMLKAKQA